jgi:uncharacterized membrane protein YraQ (UPF0718 family)
LVIYLLLFAIAPQKTGFALHVSVAIFFKILVPLCLAFLLMFVVNLFLRPTQIVELLGARSGIRGLLVSAASGIISVGPIYAWYPLLKELREQGASDALLAVFLNNRAVKPFLLPVMISYFGWVYVLLLTTFTVLGAFACGYTVKAAENHSRPEAGLS